MRRECKQACVTSLLTLWQSLPGTAHIRSPPDDCEQMRAVNESMWRLAEIWCSSPEMHPRAIAGLRTMILVLLGCLFPESIKTHRKDSDLELLLATLLAIQGIVQLRSRRNTRWAQKIIRLCAPVISMMLLVEHDPAVIAKGLKYMQDGLENSHGRDQAALYVMFSEDTTYIGKALLERAHAALGVKARIMEHFSGILRVSSPAYLSTRAKRFRRGRPEHLGFLVAKVGEHDYIKATETVAIRAFRPNGNQGQCKTKPRSAKPTRRRRPLPRFRRPPVQTFWSSVVTQRCILEERRRVQAYPQLHQAPAWTQLSFAEVYRRAQQKWFAITGQKGPLSPYSWRSGGLLATWVCTKGASVLLSPLLRGRSIAEACIRLACLVAQVQGYVRRSRGYQHVDRLLHRFRLPGRQTTYFKVPDDERSLNIARRTVRQAAKSLANKHGEILLPWVLSKVRFILVAAKRFTERRNIVVAAKSIDIMQICNTNPFMLEGFQRAEEVKLLHGNWGLQDRQAAEARPKTGSLGRSQNSQTSLPTALPEAQWERPCCRAGIHSANAGRRPRDLAAG